MSDTDTDTDAEVHGDHQPAQVVGTPDNGEQAEAAEAIDALSDEQEVHGILAEDG